jgi:8-hydroxy-5-deazaflavin:NADPH oxidoreductase
MRDSGIHDTTQIAVLGAGHLGSVVARLAIRAGYPVDIAASGDPDDITLITELVIPRRWTASS